MATNLGGESNPDSLKWFRPTSGVGNQNCIEIAYSEDGNTVYLRDHETPDAVARIPIKAWKNFVDGVAKNPKVVER